ncbi:hypothetical protein [Listeria innocua]|uniref:hypothetical protein n=1 Tax=Listeria innocua TaxID=1642 RepID=UPI0016273F4E|nr:hypothetical protein [Listeria innocua]MBC2139692.1 hypothetical protein [Listeria innocua]
MLFTYLKSEDGQLNETSIPFADANVLVEKVTEQSMQAQVKKAITVKIFEGDTVYFSGVYLAGENPLNLYQHVMQTVMNLQTNNENLKLSFLELLSASMFHTSEKKLPHVTEIPVTVAPKEQENAHRIQKKDKSSMRIPGDVLSFFSLSKRYWIRIILFLFILWLILTGARFVLASFLSEETSIKEKTPAYTELMKEGKYVAAGKFYPDKREQIEKEIEKDHIQIEQSTEEKKAGIHVLKDFVQAYPSDQGNLDCAFYQSKWEDVGTIYDKASRDMRNDPANLAKVGYAYLKLGQLDKAKNVNLALNSPLFTKKINSYETLLRKQKEVEGKLKNTNQTKETIHLLKQALEAIQNQIKAI